MSYELWGTRHWQERSSPGCLNHDFCRIHKILKIINPVNLENLMKIVVQTIRLLRSSQ
jgi:hypothetical protein